MARTNDLLVNLTQIVYLASIGVQLNTSTLPQPVPFIPDPSDVRENAFWSISLTLSVRIIWHRPTKIMGIDIY